MKRVILSSLVAVLAFTFGTLTAVASPPANRHSQPVHKEDIAAQAQWRWANQGRTVTGSPNAVVYSGNMYVYVRRPDGYLWVNWWDGSQWRWANQGRTITSNPHAVVYSGNMYVYVRRPDGNLWVNWWG